MHSGLLFYNSVFCSPKTDNSRKPATLMPDQQFTYKNPIKPYSSANLVSYCDNTFFMKNPDGMSKLWVTHHQILNSPFILLASFVPPTSIYLQQHISFPSLYIFSFKTISISHHFATSIK